MLSGNHSLSVPIVVFLFLQIFDLIVVSMNEMLISQLCQNSIRIDTFSEGQTTFIWNMFPQREVSGVSINHITTFVYSSLLWTQYVVSYVFCHCCVDFDNTFHAFCELSVSESCKSNGLLYVGCLLFKIYNVAKKNQFLVFDADFNVLILQRRKIALAYNTMDMKNLLFGITIIVDFDYAPRGWLIDLNNFIIVNL